MRRKIKFKAWDGENIVQLNDADILKRYDTVMQFTGLIDRNGIEIYEGDICRFYQEPEESCFFHGLAFVDNKSVGGEWKIIKCDNVDSEIPEINGEQCLDSSSFWNDDYEVIGNIYKNPELL